jgi:hypothetical protein
MPNPWMSLWLSAANSWFGVMRSFWTAEVRRQQTAMTNEMVRQTLDVWSGVWLTPKARPATRRRR